MFATIAKADDKAYLYSFGVSGSMQNLLVQNRKCAVASDNKAIRM
jgi:hypothetical protein